MFNPWKSIRREMRRQGVEFRDERLYPPFWVPLIVCVLFALFTLLLK